jgi:hypothetical protein
MFNAAECLKRAQECVQFSNVDDCSMQRRTILMGMARSWTTLGNQMSRLEELMTEDKEHGLRS